MSGPMNLVYPVPGDTIDTWGLALNTAIGLVEQHDHTTGRGSLVPSAGIGIDADLSWAGYALKLAKAITFTEQTAAAMTSYTDALFVESTSHNLYFRNSGGTNVQITAGNQLDLSAVGGIGGDYASVSALFSYDDATRRYLAQQELSGGLRPWAGIASGDIDLYQKAVSITNKVTLKSPNALAASYALTFPATVPVSAMPVISDAAGTLSFGAAFFLSVNNGITISGTATYKHGTKTKRIPVWGTTVSTASAVTQTAGTQGITLPNNAAVYVPLPSVEQHQRWLAAEVCFASVADASACTCELFATSGSATDTGVLITTSQFLTPGGTAVARATINLSPTNFKQLWVKVTNSTSTPHITACGVDYDAP